MTTNKNETDQGIVPVATIAAVADFKGSGIAILVAIVADRDAGATTRAIGAVLPAEALAAFGCSAKGGQNFAARAPVALQFAMLTGCPLREAYEAAGTTANGLGLVDGLAALDRARTPAAARKVLDSAKVADTAKREARAAKAAAKAEVAETGEDGEVIVKVTPLETALGIFRAEFDRIGGNVTPEERATLQAVSNVLKVWLHAVAASHVGERVNV